MLIRSNMASLSRIIYFGAISSAKIYFAATSKQTAQLEAQVKSVSFSHNYTWLN